MNLKIGSVVSHPLFSGPGTVVAFHKDQDNNDIVEVIWQSAGKPAFHTTHNLKLMVEVQNG